MTSARLQLRLQRELFDPAGAQLLALAHCQSSAPSKDDAKQVKKKEVYLCLINEITANTQFNIHVVELRGAGATTTGAGPQTGDKEELPKKKKAWPLKDLKLIDGKGNSDEMEMEFENSKRLIWHCVHQDEKKKFLSTLINLSVRHSQKKHGQVRMDNIPEDVVLVDEAEAVKKEQKDAKWPILGKEDHDGASGGGGYEAISAKETADLMALMSKCEHAVTNADLFVEDLSRELNILDGANIHSIMASEENIDNLMEMLEKAIRHTDSLENRLNQYDDLLEHIRDSMDKMEGKTVSIETVNLNNKKLLEALQDILKKLDLPYKYQTALQEADLSNPRRLRDCIHAAKALQRVLSADIDPNLANMTAVQDQHKRCEKLRDKFSKAIHRHLNNLFVHLGNDTDNLLESGHVGQLKLMRRKHIHKELMKYAELVHWLKAMDPKNFSALQATYRQNLCKLYEKDIRKFFEQARHRVSGGRPVQPVAGSASDLSGGKKGSRLQISGLLGADNDSIHSDMSLSERERFDDVMETALIELEDICMDEQFFSIHFFQMEQIDVTNPDPKKDKKVMEEARSMMAEIFPSLENELLHFISFYERGDSFFTLHALVRLSKHVLSTQDTGSFLAISFGTVLVQIKRNFDKFMQLQQRSIEESRASRKQKCGILSFISNFANFVTTTEAIFKGSERRVDLEKWYTILVNEMVKAVLRIASEQQSKTPSEVIKMENFHHLHALLSQKKISALDPQKKDLKQKYNDALNAYVTQYFGRPLEKLNVFFEGIQQLVSAGVKESEISYQLAYSKQELRKVISIYPGREVKKGLENLYKKVERHLCEEESLNQVVWRAMQEEFIRQYKNIEDLIQRCYPGAQISLDFTINEILQYFSDIARSH